MSYRQVLRAPGVSFLLATSLVARLPVAMVNLAIILRVSHATGSYARAGGVTGVYVLGTAVGVPLLGRLADRIGRRPVLVTAAAVNAAGLIGLALVPLGTSSAVFAIAAVAGISLPPVAPSVRSLWRALVPPDETSSLYAIDATLQEVTFMAGPALVALIGSVAGAPAALIVSGLIGLVGTLAVALHPLVAARTSAAGSVESPGLRLAEGAEPGPAETARATPDRPGRRRAASPALVTLVAMTFLFLTAIVIVEVSVVAFAGHHDATHQAGLLLATWSSGSLAGGLAFGAKAAQSGARRLAPLLLTAAGGFALVSLAPGVGPLYGLLFLAGVSIAPGFSCIYDLVGRTSAAAVAVEAFSWVASGIQLGAAVGAAIGGLLVQDRGTRVAFLCAGVVGAGAALIGFAARPLLTRAELPVTASG